MQRHSLNGAPFIPWTLEMGSWNWVRKNPFQLMSLTGPFNPIVPHRLRRVQRHHLLLIDFFLRAVHNHEAWRRKHFSLKAGPGPYALSRGRHSTPS